MIIINDEPREDLGGGASGARITLKLSKLVYRNSALNLSKRNEKQKLIYI